jgi:MFS transporter, PAT family, beta-lactamase induction signal transducer AmpG
MRKVDLIRGPQVEATATDRTAEARDAGISQRIIALFGLLGFSSGLPFLLFSSVLFLRLTNNGASLGVVAFFAWVSLLPTFKFAWAPMLDRLTIPGFGRAWGRWRSWILLSQLGVAASLVGLAFADPDRNLALTALWALQLAFWATTLEAAADGWRCQLAHDVKSQAPLVSAVLWGYRSAMVAAGSIAVLIAGVADWGVAYLAIAAAAFIPFPLVLATAPEHPANRLNALMAGAGVSAALLGAGLIATAIVGFGVMQAADAMGITPASHVTRAVLILCGLPFVIMMIAIPRIRRMREGSALLSSSALGPYIDFFRTLGYAAIVILAFVSIYRMGDVLTLTLAKPLMSSVGYSLTQIGIADGALSLIANIAGVGAGAFAAARFGRNTSLVLGAVFAALGNAAYVWLANVPPSDVVIYLTAFADNFGNGMAAAVFVVYLSVLVNPKYPAAQYAFLAGFAFLLPRLLAGASASIQGDIGYDGFFILSGVLSLASVLFLPFIAGDRKAIV